MQKFLVLAGALLFSGHVFGQGAPSCNDTYYLQGASQVLRMGPLNPANDTASFKKTTKVLKTDLTDLENLSDDILGTPLPMNYSMPLQFKPNCMNLAPATIKYRYKASNQTVFSLRDTTYTRIQLYDSLSALQGFNYEWWFGFYPNHRDTLVYYLGKEKNQSQFSAWYGISYLMDSVRNPSTQIWAANIRFVSSIVGPLDSVKLEASLMIGNGWRAKPWNADSHPSLFVQMVKMYFGNTISAIRSGSNRSIPSFSSQQQGQLVLIQVGRDQAIQGKALELYDMFGRKSAVLFPTGFLYTWNGKDLQGNHAPGGVYFARSGGKVLGKFVYSR